MTFLTMIKPKFFWLLESRTAYKGCFHLLPLLSLELFPTLGVEKSSGKLSFFPAMHDAGSALTGLMAASNVAVLFTPNLWLATSSHIRTLV